MGDIKGATASNLMTIVGTIDHRIMVQNFREGRDGSETYGSKLSAFSYSGCTGENEYRRPQSRLFSLFQVDAMQ